MLGLKSSIKKREPHLIKFIDVNCFLLLLLILQARTPANESQLQHAPRQRLHASHGTVDGVVRGCPMHALSYHGHPHPHSTTLVAMPTARPCYA